MSAEFRRQITVERHGSRAQVLIDGVALGGIPRDSDVTVDVNPDGIPTVRLTLMAERVDVVNVLEDKD